MITIPQDIMDELTARFGQGARKWLEEPNIELNNQPPLLFIRIGNAGHVRAVLGLEEPEAERPHQSGGFRPNS